MNNPKITVLTCVYNSEKHIEECIKSVQEQIYKNIEHLFIDNCSTDRTIDIINKCYKNPVLYSGKDQGIYYAINKGMQAAGGDVIGFLHSDDAFYDKDCLSRVADAFKRSYIDFYCSKMLVCDSDLKEPYAELGAPPHKPGLKEQLYSSTYYAHPTYYCRKDVINKVGKYSVKYKIASDIDWLMRLEKLKPSYYFDNKPFIKLRSSGTSGTHYFRAIAEEFIINIKHNGLSIKLFVVYLFHFFRRSIRFFLEIFKLQRAVSFCRKIIFKKLKV